MAYELKDGQGTLFTNDKGSNEARPDRRGELNIGGTIYELAGWIKEGKNGKWLSLQAKPKEARLPQPSADQRRQATGKHADDEIPWP